MTLTGSELLAKVKGLGDASKSDLVREAGYVRSKKDGTDLRNFWRQYVRKWSDLCPEAAQSFPHVTARAS